MGNATVWGWKGALLALVVFGLVGCQTTPDLDEVTLNVKNDTAGTINLSFTPMFDFPDSPGNENHKSLNNLKVGETRQLKLARGRWDVQSEADGPNGDIDNPDGNNSDEVDFWADGNLTVGSLIIRYDKTGKVRRPRRAPTSRNDPARLRGGGIQ